MKRWMGLGMAILVAAACSSSVDEGGSGASGGGGSGASGGGGSDADPGECPGTDPWPDGTQTCHDDVQCDFGCSATSLGGCGPCLMPPNECAMDTDCDMGFVCEGFPFEAACPCRPGDTVRLCQPVCPDTPCDADRTCDEATGHCNPTSCEAGYRCPTGMTCDGVPWADEHDCRPLDCTEGGDCTPNEDCLATPQGYRCIAHACDVDGDCACGACVNGVCQSRIGACAFPGSF